MIISMLISGVARIWGNILWDGGKQSKKAHHFQRNVIARLVYCLYNPPENCLNPEVNRNNGDFFLSNP